MQLSKLRAVRRAAAGEDGFTMIFALIVLFVGGLLVAGAFAAVNGDVKLTRKDTAQKKAYYAALAGVEQYKQRLNAVEKYWFECPQVSSTVTGTTDETYSVKTLPATGHSSCEAKNQLSVIEGPGTASGTFRIESKGTSEGVSRTIIATFAHPGFTNYVYFSNYEVEDPTTFEPQPTECEHYYAYRSTHTNKKGEKLTDECEPIQFIGKDKVNGPMHTNDAVDLCAEGSSKPTFGRTKEDSIEMNGGHYSEGGCTNAYTMLGTYTETAQTLLPPATDNELLESAGYKFSGRTVIVLHSGTPNTMTVTTGGVTLPSKSFPTNGVVYVETSTAGCSISYTPFGSDYEHDTGCGNVYVSGSYSEPLTIAAQNDVIINGSITTTTSGTKLTGTGVLGLIATNFVRVYHPVKTGYALSRHAPVNPLQQPINGKCLETTTVKGEVSKTNKKIKNLSSTSELEVGAEISGSGIPAGTTIKSISSRNSEIEISNTPTANGANVTLTTTTSSGYVYYSGIKKCVEPAESGYTYVESENIFTQKCESGSKENSEHFCHYEFTSKRCSSKATELDKAHDPNGWGVQEDPIIDAAILSTHHSFILDNFNCGSSLGTLSVNGSIAQFWRGPVSTGGGSTGYVKSYNYDDRLATNQPPEFLSSTTSWKISRETAPPTS
jgi:hypothetical protein